MFSTDGKIAEGGFSLCWPLNPEGPLPESLADRRFIGEAFFQSFPALRKWPASAVRRGLKHTAKRLGIAFDRTNIGEDQRVRDDELAFLFASVPRGRNALPSVEVYIEDVKARRQKGQFVFKFDKGLSEILWSRYVYSSNFSELVHWVADISVGLPELGDPGAFYLTSQSLSASFDKGPPPLALDDPDLARVILLFAAQLPLDEADRLLNTASVLGISGLATSSKTRPLQVVVDTKLDVESPDTTLPRSLAPSLLPKIAPEFTACELPAVTSTAADLVSCLAKASDNFSQTSTELGEQIPSVSELIILGEAGFLAKMSLIERARVSRINFETNVHSVRNFIEKTLSEVFKRTQLSFPRWFYELELMASGDLQELIVAADALSTLSKINVDAADIHRWLPAVENSISIDELLANFRFLPAILEYIEEIFKQKSEFIAGACRFVADAGNGVSVIATWLKRLSSEEMGLLGESVDPVQWPVAAAIINRLGFETGQDYAKLHERRLCMIEDSSVRRDLLKFVDPTSVVLDGFQKMQRLIVAEKLRDIVAWGPILNVTDPGIRLSQSELVGGPIVELVSVIIQHLDLIGSGSELRRLCQSSTSLGNSKESAENKLLEYASIASTSSGFYLQMREAVRERYFAPLIISGRIDIRAATSLANGFDLDNIIQVAALDVRKDSSRSVRLEARHGARISGYVKHGKELLDEFVQSVESVLPSRKDGLKFKLNSALSHLNSDLAPVASREWLEREVREIIVGPALATEHQTLRGDSGSLLEDQWTSSDTAWAQQSIDLAEFYLPETVLVTDIAAASLRQWSLGAGLKPIELLNALLERGQFAAAYAYLEEATLEYDERLALQTIATSAATRAAAPLQVRLAALEAEHGTSILASFATTASLQLSLKQFKLLEAMEQLEFLEMEVAEQTELALQRGIEASSADERKTLLQRLLNAGVEGPDERWTLADLAGRWNAELESSVKQRTHLALIERALTASSTFPDLLEDAKQFSALSLEPIYWLPEARAVELAEYLEAAIEKLRTWIQLAEQLDSLQREALVKVMRWLVGFVAEQAAALRTLDAGESSDNLLERSLEVGDTIEHALDPASCALSLDLIDPIRPASTRIASELAPVLATISETLMPLAESASWHSLARAARSLRLEVGEDDARRMSEIAEFSDTLVALEEGRFAEARDGLVTAAKVLGASGLVVNRALPVSRQVSIAFDLIATSIALSDDDGQTKPVKRELDGSWSPLLGRKGNSRHIFVGVGLTARILEQLCSGLLGREVINKLWDAPTASHEPGPTRATLLNFLHERGLNEHIISLAGRYEPTIKSRLEQLLNLRAITAQRPDLVPVSEAVASQVIKAAQGVPFRTFVSKLPTSVQTVDADLVVSVDNDIILRFNKGMPTELPIAVSIEPRGLVPESIEIILFPEDDVALEDGNRRKKLTDQPSYFAAQWTLTVRFGITWNDQTARASESFRIRVNARILTGELITRDVVCQLTRASTTLGDSRRIDDDTLLDAFPGVENTPALGDTFIGRHDELERLHGALIGARRPSPVLLTGMRRIGKTSLLYAFHDRHRHPERGTPITVYFSLAERRGSMMDPQQQVSSVVYAAIAQALGKRHFSSMDLNRELGEKLKRRIGLERDAVRNAIMDLRDSESLADSLIVLSEQLLEWAGGASRIIYLIDEAETLVLPFKAGDTKRLELEQLLQGLREVSQTSTKVGVLLSGSNHIAEFARSYKNAFFGSSLQIDLAGMTDSATARKLVAPDKLSPYIKFDGEPLRYAIDMCAGMPQFLWHLGAAISAIVRSGRVTKADVRQGVSSLLSDKGVDLPFKAYDVLEPIEHMLGLQGLREQDLFWLLLWRVANSSSLVVDEAQQSYIIDQNLLELDELESWKIRLLSLVDLEILEMPRPSMYRFKVPIFAEGFRAARQQYNYHLRHQRAGI